MTGIDAAMVGVVTVDTVEVKVSQANKKWAAFNVGVGDGDNRQYVRVSLFNGLAERAAAELVKGTKIYVEGHSLRLSEWTGRDGEKRSGLQMVGSKVEKVGTSNIGRNRPPRDKRNGTERETGPGPSSPAAGGPDDARANYARPLPDIRHGDDAIPF